jgi:DNA-binding LacI/PurR family transcriptional regulator
MSSMLQEIAIKAGVSVRTVCRVLTNTPYVSAGTRRKVLAVAEELGYIPGSEITRPRRARTGTIGLVFPYTAEFVFGDPHLLVFTRGVEEFLGQQGFHLALFPARSAAHPSDGLDRLLESPYVDGAIIVHRDEIEEASVRLRHRALPIVVLGYRSPWGTDNTVHANNRQGALYAVRHLLALGHRRIGVIHAAVPLTDLSERMAGYRQALAEARIAFDPGLVVYGDLTETGGMRAVAALLRLPLPPTAVLAFNDRMALGALHGLKQAGYRVPEDIAVVGFDDIPMAAMADPPLTTVRQPAQEMGTVAARMIVGLIEGKIDRFPALVLPALLVVRRSCGAEAKLSGPLSLPAAR